MTRRATLGGKPLRPSVYLSGIDVIGEDIAGRITQIKQEQAMGGLAAVAYVTVKGEQRKLKINAAIEGALIDMGGTDASKWRGLDITMYLDPNVSFAGKRVGGLRIRRGKAQPKPATVDPGQSAARAAGLSQRIAESLTHDQLTATSAAMKQEIGRAHV